MNTEKYTLENDISVLCVTAKSFPTGVEEAFQILQAKIDKPRSRKYYGISSPNKEGVIIYKAAAAELHPGQAKRLNLDPFTIRKGEYISKLIPDFCNDKQSIGRAFQELLAYPDIDPNGYCLEIYEGEKGVRCLVGIISPG